MQKTKKTSKNWLHPLWYAVAGLFGLLVTWGAYKRPPIDLSLPMMNEDSYDEIIAASAFKYGVEPELVKAVIWKESRFRKDQVGQKGEIGLMQLMNGTASDWARANHCSVPDAEEMFDESLNIEIGTWYLSWCGQRFPDYNPKSRDVIRLAVYNAGVGRVGEKWLPSAGGDLRIEDISFPSTRDYIRQILTRRDLYKERQDF